MKQGLTNVIQVSSLDIPGIVGLFRKTKQVCAFMGPPGCGKTESVKECARRCATEQNLEFVENPTPDDWDNPKNFCFSVVLASQIEEIDTRGLPNIYKKGDGGEITRYSITELFPVKGTGIVFLDEFPNGRTQVMNALQPMLLNHNAGGYHISDDIQFIVAGNRPSDNCGTFYIPAALRNRMAWYEVNRPEVKQLIEKMQQIGRTLNPKLVGWVLTIGHKYVDNFDPKAEQYAYGTPRSMEMASNALDAIPDRDFEMAKRIVGGWMGENAGQDYIQFRKLAEKVDIDHLMAHPETIKKYATGDQGLLYSIFVNLSEKACSEKGIGPVFEILNELDRDEYGVFVMNSMIRSQGVSGTGKLIKGSKVAAAAMPKYLDLVSFRE